MYCRPPEWISSKLSHNHIVSLPNVAADSHFISRHAIQAFAERLATFFIGFTTRHMFRDMSSTRIGAPWYRFLGTVYLRSRSTGFLLGRSRCLVAVGRHMDDCFFDFVKSTRFDVKVSDVVVHPAERAAVCLRGHIPTNEFYETFSTSDSVLSLVFADRCNQYTEDLKAGIVRELEGEKNVLGPVIFVYKRFNQHMYGVECDVRTIDLDESLKYLSPFNGMFMDALIGITQCITNSGKELPLTS